MPPSAINGTPDPLKASSTFEIALICGTPTPATIRVVQIEPGPIPIFTPSAPASTNANAAPAVAMLPPITSICGKCFLTHLTRSSTPCEWPCAVSTTITSTPASASAATRSSVPSPTPTAAPTRNLPCASLQAYGWSVDFWISLTVIKPFSVSESSITNTRSRRYWCNKRITSSFAAPSLTVTSLSLGVIMFLMGWSRLVSKRKSRLVTIPTILPLSTTGIPEILWVRLSSSTSRTVMWLWIVIGSFTTPDSKRLTRATCAACFMAVMFLWIKPRPPSCANAIASGASVTVSIAADNSGMLSWMLRESCVARDTSRGSTLE